VIFAQVGYRDRSWALFWGMVVSVLFTAVIIVMVASLHLGLVH